MTGSFNNAWYIVLCPTLLVKLKYHSHIKNSPDSTGTKSSQGHLFR
jgi:hypothetical protein